MKKFIFFLAVFTCAAQIIGVRHRVTQGCATPSTVISRGYTVYDRSGWTVTSDHTQYGGFELAKATDGQGQTSAVDQPGSGFPHTTTYNMNADNQVSAIMYFDRWDDCCQSIKDYTLQYSTASDCSAPTTITTGTFAAHGLSNVVSFSPVTAHCLLLIAANTTAGDASTGEFFAANGTVWSASATNQSTSSQYMLDGVPSPLAGNPGSRWVGTTNGSGQVIVDMKATKIFLGVRIGGTYLGSSNAVLSADVYTSPDNVTYTLVGSRSGMPADNTDRDITFSSASARYVKIVATSSAGAPPGIGEFNILSCP